MIACRTEDAASSNAGLRHLAGTHTEMTHSNERPGGRQRGTRWSAEALCYVNGDQDV